MNIKSGNFHVENIIKEHVTSIGMLNNKLCLATVELHFIANEYYFKISVITLYLTTFM